MIVGIVAAALSIAAYPTQTESQYAAESPFRQGAGTVAPAQGGEFRYESKPTPRRPQAPAILLGPVERTSYTLFSGQEEVQLLEMKRVQVLEYARVNADANRVVLRRKARPAPVYNWPKVVVDGRGVCVPTLDKSESSDWKDFLTCHKGAN